MCTSHRAWMAAAINGQAAIRAISAPGRMLLVHGLIYLLIFPVGLGLLNMARMLVT